MTIKTRLPAVLASLAFSCSTFAANPPPQNPWFAHSHWPILHGGSDAQKASPFAGPIAPKGDSGRQLVGDEIQFVPTGFISPISINWSGPYADGRQAIWVGTHQHIMKLDSETLDVLSTYVMRPGLYTGAGEIDRITKEMDEAVANKDYERLFNIVDKSSGDLLRDPHTGNCYAIMNNRNERTFYYRDRETGKGYLRFFGDSVEGDIDSPIELKREWEIPTVNGKAFIPFATNMTFDGWLVLASNSGILMAISEDLSTYYTIDLAADKKIDESLDSISSYVRSGIDIDPDNGVYVVTDDYMVRVQWTGEGFSLDPETGAWKATYPNGPRGSGTTPVLMGFGEEDKLVLIGDGTAEDPHLMVFWRDKIPENWQAIEGYDRRVAGVSQVVWPDGKSRFIVENSPAVSGWGIFATPETPSKVVPDQGSVVKQLMAETVSTALPGWEAIGGTKWQWDPEKNELKRAWMTDLKLVASMCSISKPNDLLYCIGKRDKNFTLEAINWNTGESAFHYVLGPSMRYFAYNNLVVTPQGAVDLHSWIGGGLVRMHPNKSAAEE
jgi:hypothetical protein